jgi:hypothetical protein
MYSTYKKFFYCIRVLAYLDPDPSIPCIRNAAVQKQVTVPMLGIRDIFVRIRILGFVPLTNGSGCGSGRPKNIWIRIRWRIRTTGTFVHYSAKIKSHNKKLQNSGNKGFLRYYFCLMTEGPGACFGSGSVLVRD